MRSVYIHIPFCYNICSYCDFSKIYYERNIVLKYLNSLKNEIILRYQNELINTIYIGGGTPSSLNIQELNILFDIIKIFNIDENLEFTFECNIDDTTLEKLEFLYQHNVNRLSFGVQSFNSKNLKYLNRLHCKKEAIDIINTAKKVGFTNINIDLIYGLKTQSIKSLKEDLLTFLSLDITHISTYSLIIEKHTMLSNLKEINIDEDIEYKMYQLIKNILEKNGYHQYEISNYSKPNKMSLHNLGYWNNLEYYGFGLSATSYINNSRITNTYNINAYIKGNYVKEIINETKQEQMENTMILGLRKIEGVNLIDFYNKYHIKVTDAFNITNLIDENKLLISNNYIKINPYNIYTSNEILVNFIKENGDE